MRCCSNSRAALGTRAEDVTFNRPVLSCPVDHLMNNHEAFGTPAFSTSASHLCLLVRM